jgi:hypothetical protein
MESKDKAESMLREYNFGRFNHFSEYAEKLKPYFGPFPDGHGGYNATIKKFSLLEKRFKKILELYLDGAEEFPTIFNSGTDADYSHLNFLFFDTDVPFYKKAPENLKKNAKSLANIIRRDVNKENINEVFDLSKLVLDESFNYLSKIVDKENLSDKELC